MAIRENIPKPVIRMIGRTRQEYWDIAHPYTFGAAVALTGVDVEKVALVRQTYGDTNLWQLPGGGIDKPDKKIAKKIVKSGIYPEKISSDYFLPSALRELREELGFEGLIDVGAVEHVGNYPNFSGPRSTAKSNRDTLGVFHVTVEDIDGIDFNIQRSEIEEVRLWELEEIQERTEAADRVNYSKFNLAWYLGSVATVLIKSNSENSDIITS